MSIRTAIVTAALVAGSAATQVLIVRASDRARTRRSSQQIYEAGLIVGYRKGIAVSSLAQGPAS